MTREDLVNIAPEVEIMIAILSLAVVLLAGFMGVLWLRQSDLENQQLQNFQSMTTQMLERYAELRAAIEVAFQKAQGPDDRARAEWVALAGKLAEVEAELIRLGERFVWTEAGLADLGTDSDVRLRRLEANLEPAEGPALEERVARVEADAYQGLLEVQMVIESLRWNFTGTDDSLCTILKRMRVSAAPPSKETTDGH